MPALGIIAQLGVILYMFLVGLELNPELLRGQVHATVAISHASIVVPFVLGSALALYLYPAVLAERRAVHQLRAVPGRGDVDHRVSGAGAHPDGPRDDAGPSSACVALTCAAVDDVTAWCLLALVVGVVQAAAGRALARGGADAGLHRRHVRWSFGRSAAQARAPPGDRDRRAARWRWRLSRCWCRRWRREAIGVHAIFGAFLLGAVIPHDSPSGARARPGAWRISSRCCSCRRSSRSRACGPRSASCRASARLADRAG